MCGVSRSSLVKAHPKDVESLLLYGRFKQVLKEYPEAQKAYESVIEQDPKRKDIYLLLGGLYMDQGDIVAAERIYRRLIEQFPAFYVGHYMLGKVLAKQGNTEAAEKAFSKTLQLEPELEAPRFELLKLYQQDADRFLSVTVKPGETLETIARRIYKQYTDRIKEEIARYNPQAVGPAGPPAGGKLRLPVPELMAHPEKLRTQEDKIIKIYQEILGRNPRNLRAAIELGLFYHKTGRAAEGRAMFSRLGKESMGDKDVLRQVVELYLDEKKYDDAMTVLQGLLAGAPDNPDIHYVLGVIYDERGDSAEAIAHLKKVTPGSIFFANAATHIAYLYQQADQVDQAIEYLKQAIEAVPDKAEFYLFLGIFYEEKEAYAQAVDMLEKGIALDSQNAKLYFRLGVIYDKWGKKEKCITAMKKVIALDPKHANALNYLGYTYAELDRNLDEAERLIKEALKYMPEDGYITDSLGWVYYKKGDFPQAVKHLEKAVEIIPDDPTILEHLGDAYLKINEKGKALEAYRKSLHHSKKGHKLWQHH